MTADVFTLLFSLCTRLKYVRLFSHFKGAQYIFRLNHLDLSKILVNQITETLIPVSTSAADFVALKYETKIDKSKVTVNKN